MKSDQRRNQVKALALLTESWELGGVIDKLRE